MGIITVSLQQELAERKTVFIVQESLTTPPKAERRGEEGRGGRRLDRENVFKYHQHSFHLSLKGSTKTQTCTKSLKYVSTQPHTSVVNINTQHEEFILCPTAESEEDNAITTSKTCASSIQNRQVLKFKHNESSPEKYSTR